MSQSLPEPLRLRLEQGECPSAQHNSRRPLTCAPLYERDPFVCKSDLIASPSLKPAPEGSTRLREEAPHRVQHEGEATA
eukprot:5843351-Pleurochrysis_carterae.AAC.5